MLKHVHCRKLVLCCSQQRRALNGFFYHVRYQSLYCGVTRLCRERTSIQFPSGSRDLSHLQTWLWVSPGSYSVGTRVLFQGVKWSDCNTDHSPLSSVKVKSEGRYTSTPTTYVCGIHRDSLAFFTFTFWWWKNMTLFVYIFMYSPYIYVIYKSELWPAFVTLIQISTPFHLFLFFSAVTWSIVPHALNWSWTNQIHCPTQHFNII